MTEATTSGRCSPASTASLPCRSARQSTPAALRSFGSRRALRLEHASPSGSRTVAHATTSTGMDRSRAILLTTTSCEVLLAEIGRAFPGDREQLRDHGRDAVEVARTRRTLPPCREATHRDRGERFG